MIDRSKLIDVWHLITLFMRKITIGVMGPGEGATSLDVEHGYQLGQLIAESGWVLLTGGRNRGVMESANQGAKAANGLTLGILPNGDNQGMSEAVDIAIFTNLGQARNAINVLSSDVIIACGMGAGTASEIALAIKQNKCVILLNQNLESQSFFKSLAPEQVFIVNSPESAIQMVKDCLAKLIDKIT
ncbi:putative protein AF_1126 [Planktothrix tepida]|uniref:P450 cytochrome n=3 Tax=Microcoleaceae TaxID=1892252 RepID=A0A9W4G654_9CYAN|nr:putative protein AF_1126 [Planktothrix pseudagardhii]CAD5967634.1 putative protein AF_1126 [Planktothrix tepida]CUR35142.1 putative P450 cytochrome [Planktothrix tepida PCC 9214]